LPEVRSVADVVRRVLIEVQTVQKKSRLDAPDAGSAERAFKAETEAAKKATDSVDKATEATKRHADTVRNSSVSIVRDFREAGEGAFRMARGLTLLAASGSDDMKKLVQSVALAQGAFDVFAGGFKVFTNIARTLGGPVALAITGVTAALGAGAIAWSRWGAAAQQAAGISGLDLRLDAAGRRSDAALTPTEREKRLRAERSLHEDVVNAAQGQIFGEQLGGVLPLDSGARGPSTRPSRQQDFGKLVDAATKSSQIDKELFDLEKQRLTEDRRRFDFVDRGVESAFGLPSGTIGQFRDVNLKQQTDRVASEFQKLIDTMVDKANEANRRLNGVETGTQSPK
jgi:hypothetical protein